jgi:hypothetical protein
MNNKYGIMNWPEQGDFADYYMEAVDKFYQDVYNFFNKLWFDRRTQKQTIRIDKQDTWSMDHTLAPIILPMLKQLKETKHGSPFVENDDVPEELRMPDGWYESEYNKNGETDEKFHERWDWVLKEMIYAFDCKANKDEIYISFLLIPSPNARETFHLFHRSCCTRIRTSHQAYEVLLAHHRSLQMVNRV